MSANILEMQGVSKSFPGVKALEDIHFALKKGEIHALVGENGAGKSTLMKILAGIIQPDEGVIFVSGKEVSIRSVDNANQLGIRVIHQELSLATNMTIAENIFLGNFPKKAAGIVDENKMNASAGEILTKLGLLDIATTTRVSDLSVAQMQLVEIGRALNGTVSILVMDEPTASLASGEVDNLLSVMLGLKDQGVSIVFISHKLNEIYKVCDSITVLRDGRYIATKPTKDLEYEQLIKMMVGRDIGNLFPSHHTKPSDILLDVKGINSDRVKNIDFHLCKGEVLGFYGLMGSGRSELMRALMGIDKATIERVTLEGNELKINSPSDATLAGIVLAPEDRKNEGLILKQTIDFNITLAMLKHLIRGIRLDKNQSDKIVHDSFNRLQIKAPSPQSKVINLSGGNQQKVVLAKWLATNPKVLILDEPTKGIDIGAKQEIYKLIYQVIDAGVGVILISSEMPEVINMCDRIYVLREGIMQGELERKNDLISEENILKLAMGGI